MESIAIIVLIGRLAGREEISGPLSITRMTNTTRESGSPANVLPDSMSARWPYEVAGETVCGRD